MNAETVALIEQLADSKSAKRLAAAKKLRKAGDPEAGPSLLTSLKKEMGDPRTWETQCQMIMALGCCRYLEAKDFLEAVSIEGRGGMIQIAIGDALFRISGGMNGDLQSAVEFIERRDPELIHGAFQAMAMQRVIPVDLKQAKSVVDYGCSLKLGENDWAVIWLLRAIPGWPCELIEPLLSHWGSVEFKQQQQIHGAIELARRGRYAKWSPL